VGTASSQLPSKRSIATMPVDRTTKAELQADAGAVEIEESVEPETRRPKASPSKAEDYEEYDDYDDEMDDILPEAQPGHARNEVDIKAVKFRQNALHVYGLDFLKTTHMDEIFNQFEHKFIEWINESSANVIFAEVAKAKMALEALSFPKIGDEPWRRTPDILVSEDMPPIFLQMRHATDVDSKRPKKAMPKLAEQHIRAGGRRDTRSKGRGKGKSDAIEDPLISALLTTKRPRPPITEEERERRVKRSKRFSDWLSSVHESNTAAQTDASVDAEVLVTSKGKDDEQRGIELTEEEIGKRKKRTERFSKDGEPTSAKA